jgi:ferrous iron transport protein A
LKVDFNKETPLAHAPKGRAVRIVGVDLDDDQAAWLAAVGIGMGEVVTVLRRAALGGPIHVRTSAGGELALGRPLAGAIRTQPEP